MRSFLIGALVMLLTACVSVTPQDYASQGPALDLRQYFNGKIDAWGMIQDRSGKVVKAGPGKAA